MASPTGSPDGGFIRILADWTPLVAWLGFLQYWLIYAWNRFANKGIIQIYETGSIEIGYSNLGHTIALTGTLRALNKEQFVEKIDVTLTRERDRATHNFSWLLFRQSRFTLTGQLQGALAGTHGFMLMPSQPRPFDILFSDLESLEGLRPHTERIRAEWAMFLTTAYLQNPNPSDPNFLQNKFIEFSRRLIYSEVEAEIDRACYWQTGRYLVKVAVKTAKPDKTFSCEWPIQITDQESTNLRSNKVKMIFDIVGASQLLAQVPYNFAYARYPRADQAQ